MSFGLMECLVREGDIHCVCGLVYMCFVSRGRFWCFCGISNKVMLLIANMLLTPPDNSSAGSMITALANPAHQLSGDSNYPESVLLRVLLVDDDERYLMLCQRYLARSNDGKTCVDTVGTISEALELCSANVYDCLIVDYLLPDGTGTDFIKILYEDNVKTPPPAIITTSDGGEEAATDAIRAGAVDYLSKRNVNALSLSRSINNAVEKFRLSESLKQRNIDLLDANKHLEKNRKEIMHFYHTVSHEVKTPLAAAREFVSLVRDGAGGEVSDSQNELLQLAIDSCDQIKKQFSELLDMTRLESGKLELIRRATCVKKLVTRSVTSVSELARSKQVFVQKVCVEDIQVMADADRIVQVLSNLLHNAVKFSNQQGTVVLHTRVCENGHEIEFCVEDSGCGISEAEQGSVFNRLYQSEHQRSESSACGLGLGLAISKEIVGLHGSELTVISELNKGSAFYFRLLLVAK